jgi:hypothetical protein
LGLSQIGLHRRAPRIKCSRIKEKTAPSSESSASEPKTQEKKESAEDQEKLLKDFRPSERIEAEQAVDFPYDI